MSRRLLASALVAASICTAACSDKEVLAPRVLEGPPSLLNAAPTGKIAFELELSPLAGISTANADGTGYFRVTNDNGQHPSWSPDGTRIAYSHPVPPQGIFVVNEDGTNKTRITDPSLTVDCFDDVWPHWSPDGTRIIFTRACATSWRTMVVDIATGTVTQVSANGKYPQWSPDGLRISFVPHSNPSPIHTADPDGSNVSVLYVHPSPGGCCPPDLEWNRIGSQIAFADEGGTGIYVMSPTGTNVTRIIGSGTRRPSWSPDGTQIVYDSASLTGVGGATRALYIVNADGTGRFAIPHFLVPADDIGPAAIRSGKNADWYKPPLGGDTDGDGVSDATDNCPSDSNATQTDTDGDASGDECDVDDDNDGVSDAAETAAGSDPLNASSLPETCDGADNDADGSVDEGFPNADGDAQANCVDLDDDDDGVSDVDEIAAGSDPLNAASTPESCDGADNDLDGQVDEGFANTDGDPFANCVDTDDDNDGVTDAAEIAAGSDPLNAASSPETCDGIDNDLDGQIDEGFLNTDSDALANCVDPDDDNDGLYDTIDEDDLVVSTRFRYNATAGYVANVPANVTFVLQPGAWPSGIFYDIMATAAVGPSERLQIVIDGKFHIFDLVVRRCVSHPCQGQFSDPPAQLDVEAIQESTELRSVLNGQPLVITIAEGAMAKILETSSGGVLTNVTVQASGVPGGVLVNGMPVPVGATTTIGALAVKSSLSGGKAKSLNLTGTFTPASSSDGLNPLTEQVTVTVGNYTWVFPAGSFIRASDGALTFQGTIGGIQLGIQLKRAANGAWSLKLNATPVTGLTVPTAVGLKVGNDVGASTG